MTTRPQGHFGPRPLMLMMPQILKTALRNRTYTEATLIVDWAKIMPIGFVQRCLPRKLVYPRGKRDGGTLYLSVDSGSSLMIQHSTPLMIDWINAYFGYRAVDKIYLSHQPFQKKSTLKSAKEQQQSKNELAFVKNSTLETIKDPDLKSALYSLEHHYQDSLKRCQDEKKKG